MLILVAAFTLLGETLVAFVASGIVVWLWWSIVIPRWRNWAVRSGTDPETLQRWAVRTLLVYPKGHLLEKTEIYLSDRVFFGLVGALLLATFLTVETLISEYLEQVMVLPGLLGPLSAAAIAGGLLFPVHRSLGRLLRRSREVGDPPLGSGSKE